MGWTRTRRAPTLSVMGVCYIAATNLFCSVLLYSVLFCSMIAVAVTVMEMRNVDNDRKDGESIERCDRNMRTIRC